MTTFRRIERSDGRLEGMCEHGVGHTLAAPASMGIHGFVHGCDGCCSKKEWMEHFRGYYK